MAPTGKLSSMMQVYILTTAPPWTSKIGESTVVLSNRPSSSPLQASSSSEEELSSSSSSLSPVEEPLSSLLLPGKSPARRPTKPLIDIGEPVGGNATPLNHTPEQSRDSGSFYGRFAFDATSQDFFWGWERLSALASGTAGSLPSRPMSPESTSDRVCLSPVARQSAPTISNVPSPRSSDQVGAACTQAERGQVFIRDASPTLSDPPIPRITPTPIRERHDPPAFAVTSRPILHATNPSVGTFAALDTAIAETNNKQGRLPAGSGTADQARNDQQRHSQQQKKQPGSPRRLYMSSAADPEPHHPRLHRPRHPWVVMAQAAAQQCRYGSRSSYAIGSAGESSNSRMPTTPTRWERARRLSIRAACALLSEVVTVLWTLWIRATRLFFAIVTAKQEKCKERRRSEAKAVIELGKVINGTGPVEDEDDGCQPMNAPPRTAWQWAWT
ncbi:hypothetical protein V8E53_015872 [Lactarius tabidus]